MTQAPPETPPPAAPTVTPQIYALMAKAMGAVGAVAKSHRNKEQGYDFRSIDDMYNAVQPALVSTGVFPVPTVKECTVKDVTSKNGAAGRHFILKVVYCFFAPDGSSVAAEMIGEAMDYGDKGANKAMTSAYKWALAQVFCIRIADADLDTERHSPEGKPAVDAQGRSEKEATVDAVGTGKAARQSAANMGKDAEPDASRAGRIAIGKHLQAISGGNAALAAAFLASATEFTAKDGKHVAGAVTCDPARATRDKRALSAKEVEKYAPGAKFHWKIDAKHYAEWLDKTAGGPPPEPVPHEDEDRSAEPCQPPMMGLEDDDGERPIPF